MCFPTVWFSAFEPRGAQTKHQFSAWLFFSNKHFSKGLESQTAATTQVKHHSVFAGAWHGSIRACLLNSKNVYSDALFIYGFYTYKRCASMEISAALIEEILFWRVRMVETTLMASQLKTSERVNFFFLFFFPATKRILASGKKKTIIFHIFLSIVSVRLRASTIWKCCSKPVKPLFWTVVGLMTPKQYFAINYNPLYLET